MKRSRLFVTASALLALAALPGDRASAQMSCDMTADQTVAMVRDAIANARANCPDVGDMPKEFQFTHNYQSMTQTTTRRCAATAESNTFTLKDGANMTRTITTDYRFLITEDRPGMPDRPELVLYARKDDSTGLFYASYQILSGSLTMPIASCSGIIDETETAAYVRSVIECVSTVGAVSSSYGKDSTGTWCR
jgi:hypothetical protein